MALLFKGKKKKNALELDVLKMINIKQEDADRIMGGMMRLEASHNGRPIFIKQSVTLAKTPEELNLIWYIIGVKIGMYSDLGLVVPKQIIKVAKNTDPSIQ